jgi:archaellum component FlaF (FlaF/FlaG flagellin family)
VILSVLVVALMAATGYLYTQLNQTRAEMAQTRDQLLDEISKIHETSAVTTQTTRRSTDALKVEVDAARRQAGQLAGQAKLDAEKHADELAANLRKVQQEQAQEQAQRVSAVSSEVNQVKDQTVAANTRIGEVSTDVGKVRSDVAATRSELEKTIATLKATQGDLGVQNGLIATKRHKLAAHTQIGERNDMSIERGNNKDTE